MFPRGGWQRARILNKSMKAHSTITNTLIGQTGPFVFQTTNNPYELGNIQIRYDWLGKAIKIFCWKHKKCFLLLFHAHAHESNRWVILRYSKTNSLYGVTADYILLLGFQKGCLRCTVCALPEYTSNPDKLPYLDVCSAHQLVFHATQPRERGNKRLSGGWHKHEAERT